MLKSIQSFLKQTLHVDSSQPDNEDHTLQLAATALLIEAMKADHEVKAEERHHLRQALQGLFDLSETETRALAEEAERHADEAVSLYEFTRIVKEQFNEEQKKELLVLMWRIVLSDAVLDRYEEHLLRQVADLIYVSHSQFMHAKHIAEQHLRA